MHCNLQSRYILVPNGGILAQCSGLVFNLRVKSILLSIWPKTPLQKIGHRTKKVEPPKKAAILQVSPCSTAEQFVTYTLLRFKNLFWNSGWPTLFIFRFYHQVGKEICLTFTIGVSGQPKTPSWGQSSMFKRCAVAIGYPLTVF